jgi:hypothetical protein
MNWSEGLGQGGKQILHCHDAVSDLKDKVRIVSDTLEA